MAHFAIGNCQLKAVSQHTRCEDCEKKESLTSLTWPDKCQVNTKLNQRFQLPVCRKKFVFKRIYSTLPFSLQNLPFARFLRKIVKIVVRVLQNWAKIKLQTPVCCSSWKNPDRNVKIQDIGYSYICCGPFTNDQTWSQYRFFIVESSSFQKTSQADFEA